ncbi:MAG: hypothetical protein WCF12_05435 [Propionicimonas sp.]
MSLLPRQLAALLTAGTLLIALAGFAAAPLSHAAPTACSGAWVVVQPEADAATATVTCATESSDGVVALRSAGFTAVGSDFITQINGLPKNPDFTKNGGVYWAFCTADVDASTGSIGKWTYSQVAADKTKPAAGSATGWLLTATMDGCPTVATVPEAAQSASPTATTQPAPVSGGTPWSVLVVAGIVLVAALGLGGWWWLKGRSR